MTTPASRTRSSSAASRWADDTLTQTGLAALRWLGDESGLAEGVLRLTGHGGTGQSGAGTG